MDKHQGQTLEYTIRKHGYNLSELAKSLAVNRRSLYNWFNQKQLKADIIYSIGCKIRHDFSKEFPEYFTSSDFKHINSPKYPKDAQLSHSNENDIYKNKYLRLLERFTDELNNTANKKM